MTTFPTAPAPGFVTTPPIGFTTEQLDTPPVGYQEDLIVHSQCNCLYISPESMSRLQHEISVSKLLQPGTYTIKLKSGSFDYRTESGHVGEPLVLLWIYGGKVVNQKTDVEVRATWSSLNGYGDTLILRVIEPATLCGFFFDTYLEEKLPKANRQYIGSQGDRRWRFPTTMLNEIRPFADFVINEDGSLHKPQ